MKVWTIGYERLLPQALVAELQAAGVRRVVDVRLRPQSRRPGMSKTKLGERLEASGIAYENWRELGTPVDIRALFRTGALAAARSAFREHLEREQAEPMARLLSSLRSEPPTALLCLEAEPDHCHRRVICELLRELVPELEVIDL